MKTDDVPPKPPIRRRRRHVRWVLKWVVRLSVVGLVLGIGLLFWAWNERVWLANALLEKLGGDTRVKVASLEWDDGALHVREVSATHVPTERSLGGVAHIEWRPSWEQLWKKNLGSLKVEGGSMDAGMALFPMQKGDASTLPEGTMTPWRLESLDLASTKIVIRDEKGEPLLSVTMQGNVRGGTTAATFESTSVQGADIAWQGKTISSQVKLDAVMAGEDFVIKSGSLRGGYFNLAWVQGLNPALRGGMTLDWDGRDIVISRGGVVKGGTHDLKLKRLVLEPTQDGGTAKVDEVKVKVAQKADGSWQLTGGELTRPEVVWTKGLEELLGIKAGDGSTGVKSGDKKPWKFRVDALAVNGGKMQMAETALSPVTGSFGWEVTLKDLEVSPEGVRSTAKQKVEVTDLSLGWKGLAPFAEAKRITLTGEPDMFLERWVVDSLVMAEPRIVLTPENGPWFTKKTETEAETAAPQRRPWWQRLQFGELSVKDASYAMALDLTDRLEASAKFEISTEQTKQRLKLMDAQVSVPERANLPVLNFETMEAVAALPELWTQRRFDSVSVSGGQVAVGDALMSLFGDDEKAQAEAEAKVEKAAARWTTDKVNVANVGVTILNIAPGLPPVRFDVNLTTNETPLDLNGLAEHVEPQRIVLTRLRIPSPHDPLRTVAEMDLIHVQYTLDGLVHRRIDRVDILSPLLYVGEDLFWYVENYRKYMKGEAPLPDATYGPPLPPQPTTPGWRVDTLAVADGRLLLAPKGVPLSGFDQPFPFSFTSKLESGQLDAVFDIPSDDYTLEQYKLEFRGMKGHVQFNLPMKDRNNNLTETFTVEQLRWKELHMEKAHLSVTYDANGIYGQFGGQAYKGYVNGAFNVYLDEVYTWDGWLSGVDVRLGPITRALFPTYVVLEGAAEGKIIATGNMLELYQGDLEFKNRSKGRFSIEALNDLIKELPPALKGDISQQIRRIGLEMLRNFEYEKIDGQARFYGREGRGHLRFTGPQGARNIDVNVYDHRWKEDPRPSETAAAEDP